MHQHPEGGLWLHLATIRIWIRIKITYKALVDSVFSYAAAVWFPNCKSSNVEKLQFIQNTAMRLITGCHKASSIDHLLAETKMMRVSEHLGMLCAQYLASCLNPTHPSHEVVMLPPGPRTNNQGRPLKGDPCFKIS
jgi:hypothetical protein